MANIKLTDNNWEASGVYDLAQQKTQRQINADVNTALGNKAGKAVIAPDYSASSTYAVGDYVMYNGSLYRCSTAISTAEAWTAAHWTETKIGTDVSALKSAINHMPNMAETEEDDADLYVADSDGYVIVEFSDGHIKTQNFDSAAVKNAPTVELTDATSSIDFADSSGNVLARFEDGHIKTKKFSSSQLPSFTEYYFFNGVLLLSYGYNDAYDAVIVMNEGRANGLFDFSSFKLKPKGEPLNTATLTYVWNNVTDMHSPFKFLATQNADGYHADATVAGFVGGNHTLDQLGDNFKTATSLYVHYFADGKPVTSGYGNCTSFEIKWANAVQAYNTVKDGGGGRACMTEYHDMVFDGVRFNEEVMLVPSEEIVMSCWYGFQFISFGSTYTHIRFVDGTNRGEYTGTDAKSGNAVTSGMRAYGPDHSIDVCVDTTVDLGKRTYYSGDKGAFTSTSFKGYFTIINDTNVTMSADEAYYLRGSYRFYPTITQ